MNLAWSLCECSDPAALVEAEDLCRRAVALAPHVPNVHKILGNILRLAGRHDEARVAFARAAGRESGRAEIGAEASLRDRAGTAEQARGMAQLQKAQLDLAECSFREALALEPKLAAAWNGLARIHAERGDLDLSCQACRNAIAVAEHQAEAYWRLVTNLNGQVSDDELAAMENLSSQAALSNDDRALLGFALAAVMERRGRIDRAAARLRQAHAFQSAAKASRSLTYDPDVYTRLIDQIIRVFTPEFIAERREWGIADPRPVFIVGLPRSGTTLAEQIVASHPRVHGAGELAEVQRIFYALPAAIEQPSLDAWAALSRLDVADSRAAAAQYLDRLSTLAPPAAQRVVDKNPENIQFLGLISLFWPKSRVILCRRDLRDVAVSCWRTSLPHVPWNNDPDHIARLFADYQRLLAHWRLAPPIDWLELDYESLVADPEPQSRRLIEFLGLEWDPACLNFHLNRRVVRTPSLVQVRQPVHTQSSGIWRMYEPYLGPLFEAFERHGVEFE
jgi:tetratricopeptide (TPR) repeat protein